MMENKLIVISGPSGVGKGTIVKELLKRGNFALSISCTTRAPREREENGKDYFFISREEFEKKIKENGFLEYSEHFKNYYGTPLEFVKEKLKTSNVILEIEVDGALNAKKAYPKALLLFIMPPSVEELRRRLLMRGTESAEKIDERLSRMEYELSKRGSYDYTIVNDSLNKAVQDIMTIIKEV